MVGLRASSTRLSRPVLAGCSSSSTPGLVLNWLGDSLDGTLARHRRRRAAAVRLLRRSPGGRLRRPLRSRAASRFSALMSPLVAAGLARRATTCWRSRPISPPTRSADSRSPGGRSAGPSSGSLLAVVNGLVFCAAPGVPSAGRRGSSSTSWAWVRPRPSVVLAVVAGVRGTRALALDEGWAPALGANGHAGGAMRRSSLVEGEALSLV